MAQATLADLQADIDTIKGALRDLGVQQFQAPTSDTPVTDAVAANTSPTN